MEHLSLFNPFGIFFLFLSLCLSLFLFFLSCCLSHFFSVYLSIFPAFSLSVSSFLFFLMVFLFALRLRILCAYSYISCLQPYALSFVFQSFVFLYFYQSDCVSVFLYVFCLCLIICLSFLYFFQLVWRLRLWQIICWTHSLSIFLFYLSVCFS